MNVQERTLNQSLVTKVSIVISANILLILAAKARVPLGYVDFSLQSFIVPMLALVIGRNFAIATVGAYLVEGMLGMPVFQGTPERGIGIAYMVGPTAGYLAGFLLAQFLPEFEKLKGSAQTALRVAAGHGVIHVLGVAWLAVLFGLDKAVAIDSQFWLGIVVKIILATGLLELIRTRSS